MNTYSLHAAKFPIGWNYLACIQLPVGPHHPRGRISMRKLLLAVAAGALFALPLPASAAPVSTDLSSQAIEVGPGGVRVGHDRYDSRRRDRVREPVRERL